MASELEGVRLRKLIAAAGVASRRAAETLMREGRVTVNGTVVATLGARANPETDDIRVDGRRVGLGGPLVYFSVVEQFVIVVGRSLNCVVVGFKSLDHGTTTPRPPTGASNYLCQHLERTLGGAVGEGSFGPAVFGFVMGAARLSGQALVRRLGAERLILSSAVLAVIGAIVIALSPSQIVMHGGVVLTALGVAVIVPSTNSILARKVKGPARSIAISRAWMLGLMGFFIGPALMGGLAELGSLRLSFAAVAVSSAAIIPAVLALSRR